MTLRPALQNFCEAQEAVLRSHDETRGEEGWKEMAAQTLASRLCEEMGEVFTELFGQDDVCDFLITALQDHVEECGIDVDYDPSATKKEVADVANFCMFLHDVADRLKRGSADAVNGQA